MLVIPQKFRCEEKPYQLQVGDQAMYDQKTGTISFRDKTGAPIEMLMKEDGEYSDRHFVGKDWPADMTRAFLMLCAASSGAGTVRGKAVKVEGSLPTLQTYTLIE